MVTPCVLHRGSCQLASLPVWHVQTGKVMAGCDGVCPSISSQQMGELRRRSRARSPVAGPAAPRAGGAMYRMARAPLPSAGQRRCAAVCWTGLHEGPFADISTYGERKEALTTGTCSFNMQCNARQCKAMQGKAGRAGQAGQGRIVSGARHSIRCDAVRWDSGCRATRPRYLHVSLNALACTEASMLNVECCVQRSDAPCLGRAARGTPASLAWALTSTAMVSAMVSARGISQGAFRALPRRLQGVA